jgi:hypothetical protein
MRPWHLGQRIVWEATSYEKKESPWFLETSSSHTDHKKHHLESETIHESFSTAQFELSSSTSHDLSIEPSPDTRTLKEEEFNLQRSLLNSRMILLKWLEHLENCIGMRTLRHQWSLMWLKVRNGRPERGEWMGAGNKFYSRIQPMNLISLVHLCKLLLLSSHSH